MPNIWGCSVITPILAEDIDAIWPLAAPILEPAIERYDNGYKLDDVKRLLADRSMQLWMIDKGRAFGVSTIHRYPQFNLLHMCWLAGDGMDDWAELLFVTISQFARLHGCKYLEGTGRRGWARYMKRYGFDDTAMTVRRAI